MHQVGRAEANAMIQQTMLAAARQTTNSRYDFFEGQAGEPLRDCRSEAATLTGTAVLPPGRPFA